MFLSGDNSQCTPYYEEAVNANLTTLQWPSLKFNASDSFKLDISHDLQGIPSQTLQKSLSQQSERASADITSPKAMATKSTKSGKPRRKDKVVYRRSKSQITTPLPLASSQRPCGSTQNASNGSGVVNGSTRHVDVRLKFETFQPISTLAQRKKAYLVQQMKDLERQMRELMVDDAMFGGGSDDGRPDHRASTSARTSSKLSTNNSELDSDDAADHTSSSSVPEEAANVAASTEAPARKHDKCIECGVRTLYYCTYKGCGHATHVFADYKRHEAGMKHWPQNRFMCLWCISHVSDEHGTRSCGFCNLPIDHTPGAVEEHSLLCTLARNKATTFNRSDHLVEHVRECHLAEGISKAEQEQINKIAANWRYPIDSKWPRQCGFCGVMFETWDMRMQHLAQHFQAGLTMKHWKLPFPLPKNVARGPSLNFRKDDDDEEEADGDNPFGGQGRPCNHDSSHQNRGPKSMSAPKFSQNGNSGRGQGQRTRNERTKQQKENSENSDFTERRLDVSRCGGALVSLQGHAMHHQPLALQRYLNDPHDSHLARLKLSPESGPGYDSSRGAIHASSEDRITPRDGFDRLTRQTYWRNIWNPATLDQHWRPAQPKPVSSLSSFKDAESLLDICLCLNNKMTNAFEGIIFCALESCTIGFHSSNLRGWLAHCLSHPSIRTPFFALLRADKACEDNPSANKTRTDSDFGRRLLLLATHFDHAATRLERLYVSPGSFLPKSQHYTRSNRADSTARLSRMETKRPSCKLNQTELIEELLPWLECVTTSTPVRRSAEKVVSDWTELMKSCFPMPLTAQHRDVVSPDLFDDHCKPKDKLAFLQEEWQTHHTSLFASRFDLKPQNLLILSDNMRNTRIDHFGLSEICKAERTRGSNDCPEYSPTPIGPTSQNPPSRTKRNSKRTSSEWWTFRVCSRIQLSQLEE